MKRRTFIQKTVLSSGAVALATGFAMSQSNPVTTQPFNFMSTTHPNLTLINNFFKAYGENDLNAISTILDPNIKWHIPGNHPLSGTKIGVKQVLEFFQQLSKVSMKAESIVMGVNDMYVIDCHRNWSTLEKDNLNSMSCLLWKIENNKIAEVFNFPEDQHAVDLFFTNLYR